MPEVTITVADTFQPKAGKKQGYIKDTDGVLYGAFPQLLGKVQRGNRYVLQYKINSFNGQDYKVVSEVTPAAGGSGQTNGVYPSGGAGASGPAPGFVSDKDRQEHIFVCGVVNSILSNPGLDLNTITGSYIARITADARAAYALAWGTKKPVDMPRDDMNDTIPF